MSENQLYRLNRTYWVCALVAIVSTIVLALINVDILFWEQQLFSWITYENYIPIIITIFGLSLPFWIAGAIADIKLTNDARKR